MTRKLSSSSISALVSVVLAGTVWSSLLLSIPAWPAPIMIALSFLTGALLVYSCLEGLIDQAGSTLAPHGGSPASQQVQTGLTALDSLIAQYRKQERCLLQTIAAAGMEKEALADRYQLLTENLAAAIVIRDRAGKITYCSQFTEVLTGYALADMYAAEPDFFLKITHEDDKENFQRALKISMLGEAFQFRSRFYHKTGIEMWAEMRTVPVINEDGAVTSSLSILLDVTGTVRYQKQVEERNRDLQDFSYMLTHDMKTPILTIKGMLGVIQEDYQASLSSEFQETLQHITNATKRLELLVSSILQYTKITSEEAVAVPVELNEVMQEVLRDYHALLTEHSISVNADSLPAVIGDRLKIYQIFSNLIGNAIKYRDTNRATLIAVNLANCKNPRLARIAVNDNGLGIPRNKLQDILRPFQRAHGNAIEGSGIGLACVKKMLDKLGGTIEVESTEGTGSTFIVTLKRLPDDRGRMGA